MGSQNELGSALVMLTVYERDHIPGSVPWGNSLTDVCAWQSSFCPFHGQTTTHIVIALLAQNTSQGHPDHPDGGSYAPTLSHLVPSPGQCGWSKVVTLLMNG